MNEVELKLAVHGAFSLPDLSVDPEIAEVRPMEPQDLLASYWDTADLRLARHGVTLRRRSGEPGGPRWTLKLPLLEHGGSNGARDRILRRREIELDGTDGRVPLQASDLVTAYSRTGPLAEIAELRTRRQRWSLLDGDGRTVATLVDDDVSVMDDGAIISRFRELELESEHLDDEALVRIGGRLREGGAVDAEPIPKAIRALGPAATAPADAVAPDVGPHQPAGWAVRHALTTAVDRLLQHDAGTRLGDPESLHQARVGVRTLASHLRTFEPIVDGRWADELSDELRALASALGRVRDLDVLGERLDGISTDLRPTIDPLFEDLARRRERCRDDLLQRMREEGYAALLERLVTAAAAPRLLRNASRPGGEVLPPLVDAAWRRLRSKARKLGPGSSTDDHHAVRIRAKRARYAAAGVAPALAPADRDAAERLAARLGRLQDLLGALQDAVVAREAILASAARHPADGPFNLAAGVLLERTSREAEDARAAFPAAWRRASRPRLRRWLKG